MDWCSLLPLKAWVRETLAPILSARSTGLGAMRPLFPASRVRHANWKNANDNITTRCRARGIRIDRLIGAPTLEHGASPTSLRGGNESDRRLVGARLRQGAA
jgi:hypothetical protein